jgi:hypothetical protein
MRTSSEHDTTIDPTWATRELPILRAALQLLDTPGNHFAGFADIRERTGLDSDQVFNGVRALESAYPPYVHVGAGGVHGHIDAVSERARRELGSWPSPDDLLEQLVRALIQAADNESEPEEKGRLRGAADTLGGMAREIAVSVIAARVGELG